MTILRVGDLDVPPTHGGTDRNPDRPTLGAQVEAWHIILYRSRFHPWQRLVADVLGEIGADGHRHYDLGIVDVMRQVGKTQLVFSTATHSSRRGPRRTFVYAAQNRLAARGKLIDEYVDDTLAGNVFLQDRYSETRSNGRENVRWIDPAAARSQIMITSSSDDAGHGLTKVDDVAIDEAWSHTDMSIVGALLPTQTVAVDPQTLVASTVGDGTDGLLQHYEEVGAASLLDPDTTVAYWKWAAGDDDDMADPAVWRRIHPALGRSVTEARIRSFQQSMPWPEFVRGFGNRRPMIAELGDVDLEQWAHAARQADDVVEADYLVDGILSPAAPLVIVVDISIDRTASSIAAVGPVHVNGVDRLAGVVDRRPGTAWLVDELLRLAGTRAVSYTYADRRAGAGGVIDACAARGLLVHELDAGDVVSFTGEFIDELSVAGIIHNSQPVLDDAVAAARKRPLGDAFAWSKLTSTDADGNLVDISPLVALSAAVGAHRRHHPRGVPLQRIT